MKSKFVIRLLHVDKYGEDYFGDEDGVKLFDDLGEAERALIAEGFEPEAANLLVNKNAVESIGFCRYCGSPLFPSDIKQYESQCFNCDEDFYSFEQECRK